MAYISNKERDSLIKKTFDSYTARKIVIVFEVVLLIAYIVMSFLSFYWWKKEVDEGNETKWAWFKDGGNFDFTLVGWIMLIAGIVIVILGVASIILIFTIKSPDKIRQVINKLDSSPLPGVRGRVSKRSSSHLKARRRLS